MTDKDIYAQLGRIEGKLDILTPLISSHDRRLSRLEKKIGWLSGVGAVLVGAWSWLVAFGDM